MRVLITGGVGFLGAHLAKIFSKEGWSVVVVDDMSSTTQAHLDFVKDIPGIEIHLISIVDFEKLKSVFKNIDLCVHLAFPTSICDRKFENQHTDVASIGTLNVLECCRINNNVKIIYGSSISVYGHPERLPINEQSVIKPFLVYGVNKLLGEFYVKSYHEQYNMNYIIIRIGDMIGPLDNRKNAMSNFIKSVKENRDITINNDGTAVRSYVHVDDFAKIVYILNKKSNINYTINIVNDDKISMLDLANEILRVSCKKLSVKVNESVRDERKYYFNTTNLKNIIGDYNFISIKESVKMLYSSEN